MRTPGTMLWFTLALGCLTMQLDAQQASDSQADAKQQLQQVLGLLQQTQQQLNQSQKEIDQLRARLQQVEAQLKGGGNSPPVVTGTSVGALQQAVEALQDSQRMTQAAVAQHAQVKVETESKYGLQVSGLVLFNAISNSERVDSIDLPLLAVPYAGNSSEGSLAATMRQSILGLDATGPTLWGARSSANVEIDFFGGLSPADYTSSAGNVRLRTAFTRLDWVNSSISAELAAPIVSPLSPTSYASVGEPALAWSGNLWLWAPQLAASHRVHTGRSSFVNGEFALIDPSAPGPASDATLRQPNPAESSRRPGVEGRLSYSSSVGEHAFVLGAGGYYSRQNYGYGQRGNAWAGTADWKLPIGPRVEFSGEFYRGQGLGGLGGGTFKDYVTQPGSGAINELNAVGGWSQLKFILSRQFELNAAIGQDNGFAKEIRASDSATNTDPYSALARNRTAFGNLIYRPRAYLLFSGEYRDIHTWQITGPVQSSQSLSLAAGYIF